MKKLEKIIDWILMAILLFTSISTVMSDGTITGKILALLVIIGCTAWVTLTLVLGYIKKHIGEIECNVIGTYNK